ncbi:helix-turn-helix domain-containing protein [Pseudarthrobacter sp. J75]|uniref:GlxA family transcriptional regulator n=1 Tax=unclassified Pseudarthrobacter TaxID=2647000 RepID=UPI002E7FE949|nr:MULTISPECIES: helix-turn-helix domain-containing protein [unclassified Pseudarthrobacter]MEE2521447.1 helix-turn-helix domain-containing protein [Pseudarthrobacter sp. J47]MEE2528679.1 helix-turn-helix domain-containing protein [Pseudarthrobacter sp. J75]
MLKTVALIVVPNFSIFEFGTACEVFGIDRSGRGGTVPAFDFRICTPQPGNVPLKSGLSMNVSLGLEATADADLVIMAPYGRDDDVPESVLEALRAADARGAWVMSICSGAFALARAGLLDGRRCTTHWHYSGELSASYPAAQVDENVLYVQDGNIITSAGTAAGIDACLHLVRVELGANVAASIARDMVVPPHRDGGQAQYIDRPMPKCGSAPMEALLRMMVSELDKEHSVNDLAARLHMSPRTFARKFRAETGATPAAWLNSQRVLRAQELLETSDLNIDEVARQSGFGHPVLLRHHFAKVLDTSPQSYRRAFRGQLAEAV